MDGLHPSGCVITEREVGHHGGGEGAHTKLDAAGGPVRRSPDINHQN